MRPALLIAACLLSAAVAAAEPDAASGVAPVGTAATKPLALERGETKRAGDTPSPQRAAFEAMLASEEAGEFAQARAQAEALLADPVTSQWPERTRLALLGKAAWYARSVDDRAAAAKFARDATALAGADDEAWGRSALYAWQAGDAEVAAQALAQLATRWPDILPDVERSLIVGVVEDARVGSPERLAAVQALADADYVVPNTADGGFVWFALAEERLARGELDAARAAAARIVTPAELVKLRADRRFDAIVDRDAPAFDVERAATRRVDDLRARALLDPDVLELQVALADAMLVVGDAENVLALADQVESFYAESPRPGFQDDDQRAWMLDQRARALRLLGRGDEAVAQLEAARRLDERGQRNVSQVLNLGELYCALGEPAKARAVIADAGSMSDFGLMVRTFVELCAAVQLDDAAAREAALAWMRAHRDVSPPMHTEALLYAGLAEEAVADVLARLRDPSERATVLLDLQRFRRPPPEPGHAAANAAWDALRGRADVRAAVAEVGHLDEYAIHRP